MKFIDLTGKRFFRWTVIKRVQNDKNNNPQYLCKCDCGNEKIIRGYALKRGASKSCGCLIKDIARTQHTTHGKTNTRLFSIWHGIKKRCFNNNNKDYKNYGGRGITICDEWKNDFKTFYEWAMANGYADNLSIDRIDNNGNYEPSNCRWVTLKEQANNRNNTKKITYKNETKSITEWAKILGIKKTTLFYRLKKGLPFEKAINIV